MQESGETYLETILRLSEAGPVRSVDVANALGYSKPSVSRAMHILQSEQLLSMENGRLELTRTGRERAERIYERHRLLTRFLSDTLGLPADVAAEDACRIEHVISETAFSRVKARYTGK